GFFAAQDQREILDGLIANLPSIGIRHAAVGYYEAAGDDPVAWSVLQTPCGSIASRFPSRSFPPAGLYRADEPFRLAVLPLRIQEALCGFVAFDAGYLEPCADIVRQLGAALRGVRLYQEAIEARRLAEEGKRLAEEANRLKSRFLSTVSHELRAPLNVISGISNMLLRESGQGAPQQLAGLRDDLETIYISAQHLDALIRDVLDLASSDMGRLKLSCEPLDMREVIEGVSVIGRKLARDKGLAWQVEMPPELPRVWGDRTRLRQVILNLIGNAVKFTAAGQITLTAGVENGQVRIAVSDTGLGIPLHEQEAIFDEFRQSERTATRGYGGLGLGLAICKRLVELHGGRIAAYSSGEEGGGSTFYFLLPILDQEAPHARVTAEFSQPSRVLLLVKDVAKGALVRAELAQRGIDAEMYPMDGEADWLACLLRVAPDAVALDLDLASEQGWEILKAIKENPITRDLPVLFYSLESPTDRGSLLEIDYLTKPVGIPALAGVLKSQGLLDRSFAGGRAPTVLVVDDEPETLELHARMVKTQLPDARVLQARDGREALRLMRQERPALILLDLMMPEMDGFAMLEAMRQEEGLRNTPVIVITGQTLTAEDMARLNWGVASVLAKGLFTVEETLAHVASVLAHKRRPGAESQRIVRQAMAYIHTHYVEPIALRDVAAHVGLSERHLTRCFRQEVGMTLNAYLNRYRLRQARALLEAGDKSITEVALAVGFSSSSYFARIFREEMGVSPRAYLRGVAA
ncbi:MAG: ATP-binding protein, partial [Anaerolineae bacterium]